MSLLMVCSLLLSGTVAPEPSRLFARIASEKQSLRSLFQHALTNTPVSWASVTKAKTSSLNEILAELVEHSASSDTPIDWLAAYSPLTLLYIQEQAEEALDQRHVEEVSRALAVAEREMELMQANQSEALSLAHLIRRLELIAKMRDEALVRAGRTRRPRIRPGEFMGYVDRIETIAMRYLRCRDMHEVDDVHERVRESVNSMLMETDDHFFAAHGVLTKVYGDIVRLHGTHTRSTVVDLYDKKHEISLLREYLERAKLGRLDTTERTLLMKSSF